MNRILLYVHFNKNAKLAEHVVYQLQHTRQLFNEVVFITNSKMLTKDRNRLAGTYDKFLQRDNIGYDFAAWRDGLTFVGWEELEKYDSVTMMNDTCFGPIYPLLDVYKKMENTDSDFWGMTNHIYSTVGMPGTNGPVPQHIQSYLIVFNRNVVKSDVFQDFWNSIKNYPDVKKVIQHYETQLTGILNKAGFSCQVFFDVEEYSKRYKINVHNYPELLPLIILRNKIPLLKIKAFLHTPSRKIKREIKKSIYPVALIDAHLEDIQLRSIGAVKFTAKRLYRQLIKLIKNGIMS